MFWWLLKHIVLGPALRLFFSPAVTGLENIPRRGGAILACNHESFLDPLVMPLVVPHRRVSFLAKLKYHRKWYLGWFLRGVDSIPVDTEGGSAAAAALEAGVRGLRDGKLIGVFPEGSRSPDGRLYRGRTGVARMALGAGVPVIPVGVRGTYELMARGRRLPSRGRTEVRFGRSLRFEAPDGGINRAVLREVTDSIMASIAELSGQEVVGTYTPSDRRAGES